MGERFGRQRRERRERGHSSREAGHRGHGGVAQAARHDEVERSSGFVTFRRTLGSSRGAQRARRSAIFARRFPRRDYPRPGRRGARSPRRRTLEERREAPSHGLACGHDAAAQAQDRDSPRAVGSVVRDVTPARCGVTATPRRASSPAEASTCSAARRRRAVMTARARTAATSPPPARENVLRRSLQLDRLANGTRPSHLHSASTSATPERAQRAASSLAEAQAVACAASVVLGGSPRGGPAPSRATVSRRFSRRDFLAELRG